MAEKQYVVIKEAEVWAEDADVAIDMAEFTKVKVIDVETGEEIVREVQP